MKRVISIMLLFVFAFSFGITVFAETEGNNTAEKYEITPLQIDVSCNSALLMEAETGKILYRKNEKAAASPASVTKIMTLLLAAEAIDSGMLSLKDEISISKNAAGMGGSQVFLEEGERMSVHELLKCTVIASANDAAVALAETISGSEDAFVIKMNERARELGMKNTSFENATGLDDTTLNHVTSAEDIAIMSRELIKHNTITELSSLWQDTIRNGEFTLTNTNRLVRFYDGCNGLKTGSTDKAGFCMSATAKRSGMQLIAVVMGADTRDERNQIARELLDFGFANYSLYTEDECELERIPVYSGTEEDVLAHQGSFKCIVNKSDVSRIVKDYEIPEYLSAPLSENDKVGRVVWRIGDKILGEKDIFVKDNVDKIDVMTIFLRIIKTAASGSAKKEE